MNYCKIFVFTVLICTAIPRRVHAQTDRAPAGCRAPFNVGLKIIAIPSGPKMALWYPSSDAEQPHKYTKDSIGRLAWNGTPSNCQGIPLIVFSHGFGGCGTQSLFLTEELARRGYVVAAPDHKDALCSVSGGSAPLRPMEKSFMEPKKWNQNTYADRAADIEKVLKWLLDDSEFRSVIDRQAIGLAGHSLGGYTVLGMAGGWQRWKDDRIKAVLALSPYSLPFQSENRLRSIKVPVMYQGAQLDLGITPFVRGRGGAYGLSNGPKYYVELRGGTHFEWTNLVCLGEKVLSDCLRKRKNAQTIVSYAGAFFDKYLKGDDGAAVALSRSAGVASYVKETEPEGKPR